MPLIFIVDNSITLKEVGLDEIEPIFQTIDRQRSYLGEWLPFVEITTDISVTQKFVETYLSTPDREMILAIYVENIFAGLIGMKDTDNDNSKTEIGYWLSKPMQGKGIMTKSCGFLINHIFKYLNLNRIQIKVAKNNFKSQAIPKRLGFILEGIEREGEYLSDKFVDLLIYSQLKSEWEAKTNNSKRK